MTDANLFDYAAAVAARDAAVQLAGSGLDDVWRKAARFAILVTATEHATFTTDDVWQTLASLGIGKPAEPRALGAIVAELRSDGTICPTGGYAESLRPEAHRSPKRIWRLSCPA